MERELSNREFAEPVDVELADIAEILMQIHQNETVAEPAKRERQANAARNRRRRCECGKCRGCIDNARWEAVFQEKFADPFYYSLREPKQGSALNGF